MLRFVELALCNLLYYLDSYRHVITFERGVDDVSRFEAVAAEMGVRAILREAKVSGSACVGMSPKRQVERLPDEIEDYDKGFAIAKEDGGEEIHNCKITASAKSVLATLWMQTMLNLWHRLWQGGWEDIKE